MLRRWPLLGWEHADLSASEMLSGYDVVLDSLGGDNLARSLIVLKLAGWQSAWSVRPTLRSRLRSVGHS